MDCADPNLAAVTYEIVTPPSHGSLTPSGNSTNPTRTYTAGPTAGTDSFTYRATSANGTSVDYVQSISIDPSANRVPTCFANAGFPAQVYAGRSRVLDIADQCDDPDGDPLTFTRSGAAPSHGSTRESNGQIVYTPDSGYTGSDAIGYTASDGHGGSVPQTFSVDVVNGPANTTPACAPATANTPHGSAVTVHLGCTDADGDFTTLAIAAAPDPAAGTLGTVDQDAGTVQFTPASDFAGNATFTFTASDGASQSAPATATVTVAPASTGGDGGGSGGDGGTGGTGGTDGSAGGGSSSGSTPSGSGGQAGSGGTAGTPAPAPGTSSPSSAGADTTVPGLTLGALGKLTLAKLLKSGLPVKLTFAEPCKVSAKLTIAKTLAKQLHLASADVVVAAKTLSAKAGPATLTLKLSPKARKKLAKARSLKLRLTIVAVDAAGNRTTRTKNLSLRL
jgi:hypothetical protein